VRSLARVGDEAAFARFVRAAAARTAQLINYTEIARDIEIDMKTAKAWMSILEASGLAVLLQPYHTNITKRLIKTPKLYFLDTGLYAYLTQWSTARTLASGAMAGPILETYMFSEIYKSYQHSGAAANFFFYRDRDQVEIDLLIERDGKLHPIEFKKTATPSLRAAKTFRAIATLDREIGPGAIVCFVDQLKPLSATVTAVPVSLI
jgi:predicted AAA+ superfamily ATPase